jgi:hypothetical protein
MRRMIWLLGVVIALIAGCGGAPPSARPSATPTGASPTPSPTPVTTSAATPTATRTGPLTTGPNVRPGEKPPVLSALVREHDPGGAYLLANFYFEAFDWSIATNDAYLLRKIATDTCHACARAIEGIETVRKRGQLISGGRMHIGSASSVRGTFKVRSEYVFQVQIQQDAERVTDSRGKIVDHFAGSTDDFLVFVSWNATQWKIVEVGRPG